MHCRILVQCTYLEIQDGVDTPFWFIGGFPECGSGLKFRTISGNTEPHSGLHRRILVWLYLPCPRDPAMSPAVSAGSVLLRSLSVPGSVPCERRDARGRSLAANSKKCQNHNTYSTVILQITVLYEMISHPFCPQCFGPCPACSFI